MNENKLLEKLEEYQEEMDEAMEKFNNASKKAQKLLKDEGMLKEVKKKQLLKANERQDRQLDD